MFSSKNLYILYHRPPQLPALKKVGNTFGIHKLFPQMILPLKSVQLIELIPLFNYLMSVFFQILYASIIWKRSALAIRQCKEVTSD